jgi:hypothetical protein
MGLGLGGLWGAGGELVAHDFEALGYESQAVASPLGAGDGALDIAERVGISKLFAQFLDEGLDLGEHQEHLAAEGGIEEKRFVEHAFEDEGRDNAPVAAHLAEPVVFRGARGPEDLEPIVGGARPELRAPPVAGLAHFGLAAEVVKLEDKLGVCSGGLFGQVCLREDEILSRRGRWAGVWRTGISDLDL